MLTCWVMLAGDYSKFLFHDMVCSAGCVGGVFRTQAAAKSHNAAQANTFRNIPKSRYVWFWICFWCCTFSNIWLLSNLLRLQHAVTWPLCGVRPSPRSVGLFNSVVEPQGKHTHTNTHTHTHTHTLQAHQTAKQKDRHMERHCGAWSKVNHAHVHCSWPHISACDVDTQNLLHFRIFSHVSPSKKESSTCTEEHHDCASRDRESHAANILLCRSKRSQASLEHQFFMEEAYNSGEGSLDNRSLPVPPPEVVLRMRSRSSPLGLCVSQRLQTYLAVCEALGLFLPPEAPTTYIFKKCPLLLPATPPPNHTPSQPHLLLDTTPLSHTSS
jgi:hypothetical protein